MYCSVRMRGIGENTNYDNEPENNLDIDNL